MMLFVLGRQLIIVAKEQKQVEVFSPKKNVAFSVRGMTGQPPQWETSQQCFLGQHARILSVRVLVTKGVGASPSH